MSGHSTNNHTHITGHAAQSPHPKHTDLQYTTHVKHGESQHYEHNGTVHHHKIRFGLGIAILSWMQIIAGMLILNFEAIGSVLYQTSANSNETLHGTEYAGIYVSIFSQITGINGLLSIRKKFTHGFRTCFHVIHIVLTVFLAIQTFGMACASAAMLVLFVASWDTILAFVNRVSHSAQLNLEVGTTTLSPEVITTSTLPPLVAAELAEDRRILVGLRSALFAIYFVLFVSAVIASCFGCCNYCKCGGNYPETVVHQRTASVISVSSDNHNSLKMYHKEAKEHRMTAEKHSHDVHKKHKTQDRHHHHQGHNHNDNARKH
ncbi:uncharacterized protein LOC129601106 [Paramacrobiotus metropolitanus]|uniref:uncharacterized protein LOC129601106 n=1 Tax=Paramacrobiotus metropolitanus TaxID=2943436 RepID=UPI0024459402|nr:uncharacterized protein LOC129601106 [Paramacrobiotus metropolitanus]